MSMSPMSSRPSASRVESPNFVLVLRNTFWDLSDVEVSPVLRSGCLSDTEVDYGKYADSDGEAENGWAGSHGRASKCASCSGASTAAKGCPASTASTTCSTFDALPEISVELRCGADSLTSDSVSYVDPDDEICPMAPGMLGS